MVFPFFAASLKPLKSTSTAKHSPAIFNKKKDIKRCKMSEQQRQALCPRLVDYMAIVGVRTAPPMPKGVGASKCPPVQVGIYK